MGFALPRPAFSTAATERQFVVLPLISRGTPPVSPSPKTYRIYSFDGASRVVTADFIEATSDEEAIAAAQKAGFGTKCELWDNRRMVAQLDTERRSA